MLNVFHCFDAVSISDLSFQSSEVLFGTCLVCMVMFGWIGALFLCTNFIILSFFLLQWGLLRSRGGVFILSGIVQVHLRKKLRLILLFLVPVQVINWIKFLVPFSNPSSMIKFLVPFFNPSSMIKFLVPFFNPSSMIKFLVVFSIPSSIPFPIPSPIPFLILQSQYLPNIMWIVCQSLFPTQGRSRYLPNTTWIVCQPVSNSGGEACIYPTPCRYAVRVYFNYRFQNFKF